MAIKRPFEPRSYWEERLRRRFDLTGVGHSSFGVRYNTLLYALKRRAFRQALSSTGLQFAGKDVLDVGCGTGFWASEYSKLGIRSYTGMDVTAVAVERLRERFPDPLYTFIRADIAEPDAFRHQQEAFDIVSAWDMIYHIVDDAQFARALANLVGALRPGGFLLITDAMGRRDVTVAEHVRSRSLEHYARVLGPLGISPVTMIPMYWRMNRGSRLLRPQTEAVIAPLFYSIDRIVLGLQLAVPSNMYLFVGQKGPAA